MSLGFYKIELEDCRSENSQKDDRMNWLARIIIDIEGLEQEHPCAYGSTPAEALENIAEDVKEFVEIMESYLELNS
jgi:hypothetical protein